MYHVLENILKNVIPNTLFNTPRKLKLYFQSNLNNQ